VFPFKFLNILTIYFFQNMPNEHSFIWCWNLGDLCSRSETPGKFWNVVLEKDGLDQLDRSCEKWTRIICVKEQRNILREISKRKANWIGHILRRNCLLKRVIEGKIKWGIEAIADVVLIVFVSLLFINKSKLLRLIYFHIIYLLNLHDIKDYSFG